MIRWTALIFSVIFFHLGNEEDEVDIKVCDYFERQETPEEMEERKKKEETLVKGKKKPADKKKQAVEEEQPLTVKEPQLGFVSLVGKKPDFSQWIGSIFQVIKDRDIKDVYTGRSVLKNIYPQVDGVPVYNPSGRYWVKLYYLGAARKIEIDDVFPFDGFSFRFIYPQAEFGNILWPLILSKALFKLFSFKWKYCNMDEEVGEGAVMYALTGLLPCTFKLDDLQGDWNLLEEALCANKPADDRAYIVGYSAKNKQIVVPSNAVDKKSGFKEIARQNPLSGMDPMRKIDLNQNFREYFLKKVT